MAVKVEIDKKTNELVIRMPVNKELPQSKSGKSRLVATTNGNKPTPCIVEGQNLVVSVNAYIPMK